MIFIKNTQQTNELNDGTEGKKNQTFELNINT